MFELAIWIVCFTIIIWAIVVIGIPLLILGTAVVVSLRRAVSGLLGIVFILFAFSVYDSNTQLGIIIGFIGIILALYSFGHEEIGQQSKDRPINNRISYAEVNLEPPSKDVDGMYRNAVRLVAEEGKASTSLIQRKLGVSYARAARLIEDMEGNGIIGPADGSRPRDVLNNKALSLGT